MALSICLGLVAACAVVEVPPGGPLDTTPPHLVGILPDSGTTGLGPTRVLRFSFSEKMDRTEAANWLFFYPDLLVDKTRWHGALEAEIHLAEPLPPDTVVVVEVAQGQRDMHKVPSRRGRIFPLATADSLPPGAVEGLLVMGDSAVTRGVVELFAVPPDTLKYFQQRMLRRAYTDETGRFSLPWLPAPGGPWLLRAYVDFNKDLRLGDNEPVRLLPDTVSLSAAEPLFSAGVTTLYGRNAPGSLLYDPFPAPAWPGRILAWTTVVTEADTGWTPQPAPLAPGPLAPLDPAAGGERSDVKPGSVRLTAFVDVDGDSTFGAVPESLLRRPVAAAAETTRWFLEPWQLVEGLVVEPGLPGRALLAAFSDTLTRWTAPVNMPPDSVAAPEPPDRQEP